MDTLDFTGADAVESLSLDIETNDTSGISSLDLGGIGGGVDDVTVIYTVVDLDVIRSRGRRISSPCPTYDTTGYDRSLDGSVVDTVPDGITGSGETCECNTDDTAGPIESGCDITVIDALVN